MTDVNHQIAVATASQYIREVAKARVAYDREVIAESEGKLADVERTKKRLAFCEAQARKWAAFADTLKAKEDFEDA